MKIIIDTSAIFGDWELRSPHSRLLIAANTTGEVEVVVPEVVILEAVGIYARELQDAARAHEKARRELERLGLAFASADIDAPALEVAYDTRLRRRLADGQVGTPQPPAITHLDMVRRAITKRKPFDAKGRGYRDSLIWQHVLEAADDDEVVLVTANTADFCAKGTSMLADELRSELAELGIDPQHVSVRTSIRETVREHIEPSAAALTRIRANLEDDGFKSLLYEAVNETMLYTEVSGFEDEDLRNLDVREIEVDAVEDLRDVEVDDAYEVDGEITFNFGAVVDVEADFYAYKYEAHADELGDVHIVDWDWNESMVRGTKTVELAIEGFGEYDPAAGTLSTEVWLAY